jgi:uncharacterized membrane protein
VRRDNKIKKLVKLLKDNILLVLWSIFIFLFSIIFIFLVPPFQKPDENAQFFRAAALQQGYLVCEKKEDVNQFLVPEKFFLFVEGAGTRRVAFNYNEKFQVNRLREINDSVKNRNQLVEWSGFCSLPFFAYIPFLASITFGEITGSLLVSFYLSRVIAFIFFVVCIIYSYSIIKNSKLRWVVLAYSLLPMVLHQASAVGYDYLQLALAPILFSLIVRMSLQKEVKLKEILKFLFFMVVFLIAKPGYYFVSLIFLLIPSQKISESKKKYLFTTFIYFLISFSCGILTAFFFRDVGLFDGSNGINPLIQIKTLLDLEFTYHLIRNTLNAYFDFYVRGFWGRFGWLDYDLPTYLYPLISFSCMVLVFYLQKDKIFKDYARIAIVSFGTIVTSIAFLFLTVYLTWNPVGNSHIVGIQGRYFLVLIPIIFLFLGSIVRGFVTNKKFRYILSILILSLILLELFLVVSDRYYALSVYKII